MRPSHGDRVDQLQLRFHKLALRTPNDGDLVALPFGLRYPAFPKSIGRIGIVDEDAVADLVSQQPRPRLWGAKVNLHGLVGLLPSYRTSRADGSPSPCGNSAYRRSHHASRDRAAHGR